MDEGEGEVSRQRASSDARRDRTTPPPRRGAVAVRVLFWGTPEFATPCLRALIGEGFEVVAVVTQPDRATGRSRSTLQPPPIKTIALEESIPVLQPEKPRDEEFLNTI